MVIPEVLKEEYYNLSIMGGVGVEQKWRDRILSILKHRCFCVWITCDVKVFCKNCHRCVVAKLPHSVPIHEGKSVRGRVQVVSRVKIQDMFSGEIYIVIQAPNMAGGPYFIKQVT